MTRRRERRCAGPRRAGAAPAAAARLAGGRAAVARMIALAVGLVTVLGAGLLLVSGCDSAADDTTATSVGRLDKLTLVAPPGPMAIPMAYLVANDSLAEVAEETKLVVWENADQLKAMVAGGQGDFVTVPSNNAAMFYNKGMHLQLLDISVWNITYLITSDVEAASFADIAGQSLAVSLQGSVPDVMFQYLAMKEGLDPTADFGLRYVADPTEAAQLLLAGQVQNAVLSEALATKVVLQSKDTATPLHRALAFDAAWTTANGGDVNEEAIATPIAGVIATATVMGSPDIIATFEREYAAAIEWMLDDPEAAGRLVETELPQLGLSAGLMTASLQNITWEHMPAADARMSLEAFYTALMELSPEVVGGELPDDAFYYAP